MIARIHEDIDEAVAPGVPGARTAVDADRYRLHAEICKVLTDPKRLVLLAALRDGERSVGELAAAAGASLANASQHLSVLRAAGIVDGRRSGTGVRYRLSEPGIVDACDAIDRIVRRRLGLAGRSRPTLPELPARRDRTPRPEAG
jgi:ArsR family transcriptional regulator